MEMDDWEKDITIIRLGDALLMDWYHLLQAYVIFMEGNHDDKASFYYHIRRVPFGGSYLMVAGTELALRHLYNLKFTERDIETIKVVFKEQTKQELPEEFLEYLRNFKFKGNVWAMREGSLAFPNEPIIWATGGFLEVLIVESAILSLMNSSSLVATKASRIVEAAGHIKIAEFGMRRSDNLFITTRASIIGGCKATSNVAAVRDLGAKASGTMAHAFMQFYTTLTSSEEKAFLTFSKHYPNTTPILLVDTYDSIEGIKKAIRVAEKIGRKVSIRLDSGNLIELAMKARELDTESRIDEIVPSGDLNEFKLEEIRNSKVDIKLAGVGTEMVKPSNPSALGGIYKLDALEAEGVFIPTLKISSDPAKATLPGRKTVWRKVNESGEFAGDVIALLDEDKPGDEFEPVLVHMMEDGKMLVRPQEIYEIQKFAMENIRKLPKKHRRISNPEKYPLIISDKLLELRRRKISEIKEKQKFR